MSATIIMGVDFKRKSQKQERVFWIGPEGEVNSKVVEPDTAPSEMPFSAPESDPA